MWLISLINILLAILTVRALSIVPFLRHSSVDNNTCSGVDYLFYDNQHVRNAIDCLHLCQKNSSCHGVFYSPGNVSCTGCTLAQGDMVPANESTNFYMKVEATKFNQPCNSTTDCGLNLNCSTGKCGCLSGLNYDPTMDACISDALQATISSPTRKAGTRTRKSSKRGY